MQVHSIIIIIIIIIIITIIIIIIITNIIIIIIIMFESNAIAPPLLTPLDGLSLFGTRDKPAPDSGCLVAERATAEGLQISPRYVTSSDGLAKVILQGTIEGKRRRGRQKKKWTDNIEEWTGPASPSQKRKPLHTTARTGASWCGSPPRGAPTTLHIVKGASKQAIGLLCLFDWPVLSRDWENEY